MAIQDRKGRGKKQLDNWYQNPVRQKNLVLLFHCTRGYLQSQECIINKMKKIRAGRHQTQGKDQRMEMSDLMGLCCIQIVKYYTVPLENV